MGKSKKKRHAPRRNVTLCLHTTDGKKVGRRKLWAFSWDDLAQVFGASVKTVQSWTKVRGRRQPLFQPNDLESIVRLYNERKEDAYRRLLNRGAHKLPRRDSPQFGPEDEYGHR